MKITLLSAALVVALFTGCDDNDIKQHYHSTPDYSTSVPVPLVVPSQPQEDVNISVSHAEIEVLRRLLTKINISESK